MGFSRLFPFTFGAVAVAASQIAANVSDLAANASNLATNASNLAASSATNATKIMSAMLDAALPSSSSTGGSHHDPDNSVRNTVASVIVVLVVIGAIARLCYVPAELKNSNNQEGYKSFDRPHLGIS